MTSVGLITYEFSFSIKSYPTISNLPVPVWHLRKHTGSLLLGVIYIHSFDFTISALLLQDFYCKIWTTFYIIIFQTSSYCPNPDSAIHYCSQVSFLILIIYYFIHCVRVRTLKTETFRFGTGGRFVLSQNGAKLRFALIQTYRAPFWDKAKRPPPIDTQVYECYSLVKDSPL